MMTFTELTPAASELPEPFSERLRLAVAAYLARFKGSSREHTESDLRCYLAWCAERGLDPLAARRPHLELYIRWMQEIRRFKPSTVSRRFCVVAGFYRTCVLDGLIEHSPAEHVRRPAVPAESPTLGFTHLQFEALLTAARESPNPCDFALVAMLGLLGLQIFEATSADIADLGEEHGYRVLRVCGKGSKVVQVPLPLPSPPPLQTWPPLQQTCSVVLRKTTFSLDEVQAAAEADGRSTFFTLWVVLDGFDPNELNVGALTPEQFAPLAPDITLTVASTGAAPQGMNWTVGSVQPDGLTVPPVPQQFTFPVNIFFIADGDGDYPAFSGVTPGAPALVMVQASFTSNLTWTAPPVKLELLA
jgi:integrase